MCLMLYYLLIFGFLMEKKDKQNTTKEKIYIRIFVSMLGMIVENSAWETLKQSDITMFRKEIERFKEGKITLKDLKIFSQKIYRSKLSLFKENNKDSEIEKYTSEYNKRKAL